eukprot:830227-Alexandrium_andersonii.AAC.1
MPGSRPWRLVSLVSSGRTLLGSVDAPGTVSGRRRTHAALRRASRTPGWLGMVAMRAACGWMRPWSRPCSFWSSPTCWRG